MTQSNHRRRGIGGRRTLSLFSITCVTVIGCSSTSETNTQVLSAGGGTATGGESATGGSAIGGTSAAKTGGDATGGKASTSTRTSEQTGSSGGTTTTGSSGSGGKATGGNKATGGKASGGAATGGKSSSSVATGGNATGGTAPTATGGKASSGGTQAGGGGAKATGGTGNTAGQSGGGVSSTGGSSGTAGQTSGGNSTSSGCGKAPGISSSQYNNDTSIDITAAGWKRRYILNVPKNYDNTHPYTLVVTMHARDGNDKQMFDWQFYNLLSQSNGTAIFVAPNGQVNGAPCQGTSKSGESMCGWPNSDGKDLALVDAVVAQVQENFCIDNNKIFATGWSYGGSMSYDIACERPLSKLSSAGWGVRAIAIYAAAKMSGNCTPSAPVAYYHSHGTNDTVLDYERMGIPIAQSYATANGCTWATPTKVTGGNHVCSNMAGCKTGYPLEFCSFSGGHTPYPDGGQPQNSWGPQEAWKFLKQFQ